MPAKDQQTADDNNFTSSTFSPCKAALIMKATSGFKLQSNTSLAIQFPALGWFCEISALQNLKSVLLVHKTLC